VPDLTLGPRSEDFIWASGIEDTFVPQTRTGHRALDEYQLMGHYDHWRDDLALARDLGVQALRWGVPWYRVEPLPSEFDWQWTDQVIPYLVQELGITPIIDLMHYGCPFWLRREFISDEYPQAVAAYAAAFARRYGSLVRWYTPLNEPQVNAMMCGQRGLWPPYLRGTGGFVRIMLQLVKGIILTVETLKSIRPDAMMVHVDATGLSRAALPELAALAQEDQLRGYLCYDLLTGRVTPDHPLFPWLVRHGASVTELAQIAARPLALDVLGINFYPQWSTRQLQLDERGRLAYRITEQAGTGFGALILDYYKRYQAPIIVTETSAHGSELRRERWLDTALAAIKALRRHGVPVMGYTWFPLFTMIDWRYRFGRGPVEEYRIELGLYHLGNSDGDRRWIPSPLTERFRQYVQHPEEAIGPLLAESPQAAPAQGS
jgi:beta-glucosidase/6-phospho-beta-glucosidase/beta-galactosidase